jgi:hypothetical protein
VVQAVLTQAALKILDPTSVVSMSSADSLKCSERFHIAETINPLWKRLPIQTVTLEKAAMARRTYVFLTAGCVWVCITNRQLVTRRRQLVCSVGKQ